MKVEYPTATVNKILALRLRGRKVEQLTPYQFRIDNAIDIYPINHRFHILKTGRRGFIPLGIL